MKRTSRLLAMVMALVMLCATAMPALAEDEQISAEILDAQEAQLEEISPEIVEIEESLTPYNDHGGGVLFLTNPR